MGSLSAHLRESGDHGRLGFHPACPVCCDDRLAGKLPNDAFVTARTTALLATGVLVVSAASPASVLAQSGGQEATGAPSNTSTDEFANPDAAPGASDDLPLDQSSSAPADPDDDTGPVGPDVAEEADPGSGGGEDAAGPSPPAPASAPVATATPGAANPAKPAAGAPAIGLGGSTAATAPPAAPESDGSPPANAPAPQAAPVASDPLAPVPAKAAPEEGAVRTAELALRRAGSSERGQVRHRERVRVVERRVQARVVAPTTQQPSRVASVSQVSVATTVARPAVASAARRARAGNRVHVVLPGESLWSIASDVLGGRATVANVAREVNRLWDLNRARIGTGDRDLLPVGTRLELT